MHEVNHLVRVGITRKHTLKQCRELALKYIVSTCMELAESDEDLKGFEFKLRDIGIDLKDSVDILLSHLDR